MKACSDMRSVGMTSASSLPHISREPAAPGVNFKRWKYLWVCKFQEIENTVESN